MKTVTFTVEESVAAKNALATEIDRAQRDVEYSRNFHPSTLEVAVRHLAALESALAKLRA